MVEQRSVKHDDEALLTALRGGDREARSALVDRYGAHLRGVLRRTLGSDPDVPDLLQDVLIGAFVGIEGFRGTAGQLRAWLTSIALFRARECIRRRATRRALRPQLTHFAKATAHGGHDPVTAEAVRRLSRILDRLPDDERRSMLLRVVDELALEEVASATGVSLATVKRRLFAGRNRVRAMAEQDIVLKSWRESRG